MHLVLNWNGLYVYCFRIITFGFLKNKKYNIKTLFFCWNKTKILILQAVSNNATYKTFQLIGYRHHKHNTMSGLAGDLFLLHLFPKPFHLFFIPQSYYHKNKTIIRSFIIPYAKVYNNLFIVDGYYILCILRVYTVYFIHIHRVFSPYTQCICVKYKTHTLYSYLILRQFRWSFLIIWWNLSNRIYWRFFTDFCWLKKCFIIFAK